MVEEFSESLESGSKSKIVDSATKMSYGVQAISWDTGQIDTIPLFEEANSNFRMFARLPAEAAALVPVVTAHVRRGRGLCSWQRLRAIVEQRDCQDDEDCGGGEDAVGCHGTIVFLSGSG